MADRTSAGIFGQIFEMLAENPTDEHKQMALKIWPMAGDYDFSTYQMGADDALILLGLAKMGTDPSSGKETVFYYGEEGFNTDETL